jgi:hypothetical protein
MSGLAFGITVGVSAAILLGACWLARRYARAKRLILEDLLVHREGCSDDLRRRTSLTWDFSEALRQLREEGFVYGALVIRGPEESYLYMLTANGRDAAIDLRYAAELGA